MPDALKCPITHELFRDPVVAEDGYTYEKRVIIEWIRRAGNSPFTRQPLLVSNLRPNYAVRQLVEEFKLRNLNLYTVPCSPTNSVPESYPTRSNRQLDNTSFPLPYSNSYQRRRVALLIGNDSYDYISKLACCCRDVQGMFTKLSALCFDCTVIFDANKQQMNYQLERLTQNIRSNDCVLIFFSGHGGESNVS